MKSATRNILHFYVDWPLLAIFVVLVFVFRTLVVDELLLPVANALSKATSNSVGATLLLAILANLFTSGLLLLIGYILLRQLSRALLAGDYKAYAINNGQEEDFGTATILYAPLALSRNGVPVKLRLKHADIELEGQGLLVNNQYLVGHYSETGNPVRRRCGSFHYQLDGDGQTWRGKYVFVSPDTAAVTMGEAKWKRS